MPMDTEPQPSRLAGWEQQEGYSPFVPPPDENRWNLGRPAAPTQALALARHMAVKADPE